MQNVVIWEKVNKIRKRYCECNACEIRVVGGVWRWWWRRKLVGGVEEQGRSVGWKEAGGAQRLRWHRRHLGSSNTARNSLCRLQLWSGTCPSLSQLLLVQFMILSSPQWRFSMAILLLIFLCKKENDWILTHFYQFDPAIQVVKAKFPEVRHVGDVRRLAKPAIREEIDLIVGGFPCQDLSCLGKKEG